MNKHSPLPWESDQQYANVWRILSIRKGCIPISIGQIVTTILETGTGDDEITKANAEYIVKACNAYPELVELLKQCQGLIAGSEYANGEVHTLVKILLKRLGELPSGGSK